VTPSLTPPITGADLPRLGWHHSTDLDPAKFEPVTCVPREDVFEFFTKPMPGGLWCSPIHEIDGIVGNDWLTAHGHRRHEGKLWEVIPTPDAKIFVIDHSGDLNVALERWPDPRDSEPMGEDRPWIDAWRTDVIDWPAMATDFDAVMVTAPALSQLNLPNPSTDVLFGLHGPHKARERHLWGWDVPTVLFLQPTFTVGPSHPADPETVRRWRTAFHAKEEAEAVRIRAQIIETAAKHGVELDPHLLQLPPVGFLMVMARAMQMEEEHDA